MRASLRRWLSPGQESDAEGTSESLEASESLDAPPGPFDFAPTERPPGAGAPVFRGPAASLQPPGDGVCMADEDAGAGEDKKASCSTTHDAKVKKLKELWEARSAGSGAQAGEEAKGSSKGYAEAASLCQLWASNVAGHDGENFETDTVGMLTSDGIRGLSPASSEASLSSSFSVSMMDAKGGGQRPGELLGTQSFFSPRGDGVGPAAQEVDDDEWSEEEYDEEATFDDSLFVASPRTVAAGSGVQDSCGSSRFCSYGGWREAHSPNIPGPVPVPDRPLQGPNESPSSFVTASEGAPNVVRRSEGNSPQCTAAGSSEKSCGSDKALLEEAPCSPAEPRAKASDPVHFASQRAGGESLLSTAADARSPSGLERASEERQEAGSWRGHDVSWHDEGGNVRRVWRLPTGEERARTEEAECHSHIYAGAHPRREQGEANLIEKRVEAERVIDQKEKGPGEASPHEELSKCGRKALLRTPLQLWDNDDRDDWDGDLETPKTAVWRGPSIESTRCYKDLDMFDEGVVHAVLSGASSTQEDAAERIGPEAEAGGEEDNKRSLAAEVKSADDEWSEDTEEAKRPAAVSARLPERRFEDREESAMAARTTVEDKLSEDTEAGNTSLGRKHAKEEHPSGDYTEFPASPQMPYSRGSSPAQRSFPPQPTDAGEGVDPPHKAEFDANVDSDEPPQREQHPQREQPRNGARSGDEHRFLAAPSRRQDLGGGGPSTHSLSSLPAPPPLRSDVCASGPSISPHKGILAPLPPQPGVGGNGAVLRHDLRVEREVPAQPPVPRPEVGEGLEIAPSRQDASGIGIQGSHLERLPSLTTPPWPEMDGGNRNSYLRLGLPTPPAPQSDVGVVGSCSPRADRGLPALLAPRQDVGGDASTESPRPKLPTPQSLARADVGAGDPSSGTRNEHPVPAPARQSDVSDGPNDSIRGDDELPAWPAPRLDVGGRCPNSSPRSRVISPFPSLDVGKETPFSGLHADHRLTAPPLPAVDTFGEGAYTDMRAEQNSLASPQPLRLDVGVESPRRGPPVAKPMAASKGETQAEACSDKVRIPTSPPQSDLGVGSLSRLQPPEHAAVHWGEPAAEPSEQHPFFDVDSDADSEEDSRSVLACSSDLVGLPSNSAVGSEATAPSVSAEVFRTEDASGQRSFGRAIVAGVVLDDAGPEGQWSGCTCEESLDDSAASQALSAAIRSGELAGDLRSSGASEETWQQPPELASPVGFCASANLLDDAERKTPDVPLVRFGETPILRAGPQLVEVGPELGERGRSVGVDGISPNDGALDAEAEDTDRIVKDDEAEESGEGEVEAGKFVAGAPVDAVNYLGSASPGGARTNAADDHGGCARGVVPDADADEHGGASSDVIKGHASKETMIDSCDASPCCTKENVSEHTLHGSSDVIPCGAKGDAARHMADNSVGANPSGARGDAPSHAANDQSSASALSAKIETSNCVLGVHREGVADPTGDVPNQKAENLGDASPTSAESDGPNQMSRDSSTSHPGAKGNVPSHTAATCSSSSLGVAEEHMPSSAPQDCEGTKLGAPGGDVVSHATEDHVCRSPRIARMDAAGGAVGDCCDANIGAAKGEASSQAADNCGGANSCATKGDEPSQAADGSSGASPYNAKADVSSHAAADPSVSAGSIREDAPEYTSDDSSSATSSISSSGSAEEEEEEEENKEDAPNHTEYDRSITTPRGAKGDSHSQAISDKTGASVGASKGDAPSEAADVPGGASPSVVRGDAPSHGASSPLSDERSSGGEKVVRLSSVPSRPPVEGRRCFRCFPISSKAEQRLAARAALDAAVDADDVQALRFAISKGESAGLDPWYLADAQNSLKAKLEELTVVRERLIAAAERHDIAELKALIEEGRKVGIERDELDGARQLLADLELEQSRRALLGGARLASASIHSS